MKTPPPPKVSSGPLNRHLPILLAIAAWLLATPRTGAAAAAADLFVSPRGDDNWSGRLSEPNDARTDGPLATLDAARLAVRKLRQQGGDPRPVTVLFRGGTYFLSDTVAFTAEDSGTQVAPATYAAYPGENPVLSGGVRIDGWAVGPDGRWRVTLPQVKEGKWDFAQLFVNGQRRHRPRLPKQGYYFIAAQATSAPATRPGRQGNAQANAGRGQGDDRFRYPAGSIRGDWKNLGDVEVISFHPWFTSMLRIASVDPEKNVVAFTGHTRSSAPYSRLSPGVRFLVDNVAEALDTPGEWYLDRTSGELTYLPMPGESPEKTEVIAPRLEKLLEIAPAADAAGELKTPWVQHLTFRGLTFSHTNWTTPKEGYSVPQAAVTVTGAVHARGARDCAFVDCAFTRLGTYGLEWDAACHDDTVEECRFADLGAGGVKIGTQRVPSDPEQATTNIAIRNNLIAHLGRIHPAAVGVWIGQADHCTIEHNDIYDLYYTGVSIGWTWGYGPSAAHHNTVVYNRIHHLGQGVLGDMGGVYTLGVSPGTTIHHNVFHDIERYGYGGWGIYFDEGSTGVVAENNLVYNTHDGGFHQHYGENNVYRNNILANSREVQFGPTRIDWPNRDSKPRPGLAFTFEHNIVYEWGSPSVIRPEWLNNKLTAAHLDHFSVDYNLYWNPGKPPKFAGLSFEQWQQKGLDKHSEIADPLFIDPANGDYRLRPDSPALRLGFLPFDVSTAGRLRHDPPDLEQSRWPRAFPPP